MRTRQKVPDGTIHQHRVGIHRAVARVLDPNHDLMVQIAGDGAVKTLKCNSCAIWARLPGEHCACCPGGERSLRGLCPQCSVREVPGAGAIDWGVDGPPGRYVGIERGQVLLPVTGTQAHIGQDDGDVGIKIRQIFKGDGKQ
jgi:hypothetical protein